MGSDGVVAMTLFDGVKRRRSNLCPSRWELNRSLGIRRTHDADYLGYEYNLKKLN